MVFFWGWRLERKMEIRQKKHKRHKFHAGNQKPHGPGIPAIARSSASFCRSCKGTLLPLVYSLFLSVSHRTRSSPLPIAFFPCWPLRPICSDHAAVLNPDTSDPEDGSCARRGRREVCTSLSDLIVFFPYHPFSSSHPNTLPSAPPSLGG